MKVGEEKFTFLAEAPGNRRLLLLGELMPKGNPSPKFSRLALVRGLIQKCSDQLNNSTDLKTGVAEFIRLLSLEKELAAEDDSVRKVIVSWQEPSKTEPAE